MRASLFYLGSKTSQDLKSSNMLEVSMALIIICKLIGSEMIPPLLPLIQDKLLHPKYTTHHLTYIYLAYAPLHTPTFTSHISHPHPHISHTVTSHPHPRISHTLILASRTSSHLTLTLTSHPHISHTLTFTSHTVTSHTPSQGVGSQESHDGDAPLPDTQPRPCRPLGRGLPEDPQ